MYYPLTKVVRQSDATYSLILTKIGDGRALLINETNTIESRFIDVNLVDEQKPEAVRLFHTMNEPY